MRFWVRAVLCLVVSSCFEMPWLRSGHFLFHGTQMATVTVSDAGRIFTAIENKISRATAKTLSAIAKNVRDEVTAELPKVFDRPTPWTMRSLYWRGASVDKGRMTATVWFKDFAAKGTPADKYLRPQVLGGGRGQKRMERGLQQAGILPAGMMVVPGRSAKLDAYGNISRGQIVQILAYFRAFGEQGYAANMTDKRRKNLARDKVSRATGAVRKGFSYFVLRQVHNGLPPGVYMRLQYGEQVVLRPILIFIRSANYRPRLAFYDIASKVADRDAARLMAGALVV